MTVSIKPAPLGRRVQIPPSKSFAHRLLIGSALAGGKSRINGIINSEDMKATLNCLSALGADISLKNGIATLEEYTLKNNPNNIFPCNESGSTLRFFMPIACVLCGGGIFRGSERLIERGIGVYEEVFGQSGIEIKKAKNEIVLSGYLKPDIYEVRGNISSQFITGLLFALPLAQKESIIKIIPPVESRSYIDITLEVLKGFGIEINEINTNVFRILPNQKYIPGDFSVEGDWSNGAFFVALQKLHGNIEIGGLDFNSIQGDKVCLEYLERLQKGYANIDISDCPDLGPVLFAFSSANHGGKFTGTNRLKIKESDRVGAMAEELYKFGIKTAQSDNTFEIKSGALKTPFETLNGHNDHRIVMALSVLLTLTGGKIDGAESVAKSFPDFFEALKNIGCDIERLDG